MDKKMEEVMHQYVVLFSCKDDEGVIQDHPLRPFELKLEADMYLDGYVDAIINHTAETNIGKVKGLFRISKIGEENYGKKTPTKKVQKQDSINEAT